METQLARLIVSGEVTDGLTVVVDTDGDEKGGLILRIGDEKFDASVATKLKKLGSALRNRASREIHSGRAHWEGSPV